MPFFKNRIDSFKYAITGIGTFFRNQTHPKIHLLAAVVVSTAGFLFEISTSEWLVLILTMTIVIVAEAFNSAIELLCNKVTTEQNPIIKDVKDISAGGSIDQRNRGCYNRVNYILTKIMAIVTSDEVHKNSCTTNVLWMAKKNISQIKQNSYDS